MEKQAYYTVSVVGLEAKRFETGHEAGFYAWCHVPPMAEEVPQSYQCDGDGNCHPVNTEELIADYFFHFESVLQGMRERPDAPALMPMGASFDSSKTPCPVCGAPSDGYPCQGCMGEGNSEGYAYLEPEDPGAVDNEMEPGDEHFYGR